MKILVTGGAGYIGSVLVPMLVERGHDVTVVDRLFFGRDKLPPDGPSLRVIEGDVRFVGKDVVAGHDAVIDLAAISNDPSGELDPTKTHAVNHLGRVRMASLAKSLGVARYILPSSCSIYGFQDDLVSETSKVNPLTTYAVANFRAEQDIAALAGGDFTVVILRQATVYGLSPRMRFDLAINGMTRGFSTKGKIPILRDGTQWRPMVHVRDTSAAMCAMLTAPAKAVNGQIFNVGCAEQNYQIFDLARRVAGAIGIEFAYEWYGDPDHRSYRVSFDKIRDAVGFAPAYTAEHAAREVWDALKAGAVAADDPQTITLTWYKKLLAEGVDV